MEFFKLIKILFFQKNTLEYFRFNHYPAPLTGYDNLFQVSPGEILEFRNKKILKKKYWDIQRGGNYNIFFKKNNTNSVKKYFLKLLKTFLLQMKK